MTEPLPHHERIQDPVFRHAVDLLDRGDAEGLRRHLGEHPGLVHRTLQFDGNYFQNPSLLDFVAENPIRHGKLPANIVEVAAVILDAGAKSLDEALGLVGSGLVPRECGVQISLIDLLCSRGADPNRAMYPALTHGEFEAVNALLQRGAQKDLTVAAALGEQAEAERLLAESGPEQRHQALAMAAYFGHAPIVKLLLDAGEDPSRFNPPGFHAHGTPLHWAAYSGHEEVVRLLVERGANLEMLDPNWQGNPAGWAHYAGRTEIEKFLLGSRSRTDATSASR